MSKITTQTKLVALVAALLFFNSTLFANETEKTESDLAADKEHYEKGVYVAAKALITLGDTKDEGESILQGGMGKGVGVELGYKFSYGLALEADATHAKNRVTEKKFNETSGEYEFEESDGSYSTVSLDLVYNHHLNHYAELFIKGGYEMEFEKIADFNIDTTNSGVVGALGAEFTASEQIALLLEYEASSIKGPRGNSVFAGVVYRF